MHNGSKNLNGVPMKKVAKRLNALNSYLKHFRNPDNTSFSTGDIICVAVRMILNDWCKIIAQARTKPREMEFDKIIAHLKMFEETTLEYKDSEGNQDGTPDHS